MMSAGISIEGTTNQISTRWQYLSTQGKQKIIPSSWIQMGPAKVCGGWETEHKSFSAGSVQNVFPSTLLTLFSDLREDLTRHQIFTQCGSSWTGFHLHLTSDVFLGACGKAFHFHRSRSWWWGWLTLTGPSCLVLPFYPICFSGVGVFQVKYDGQLRTNEDELACDLHCLRVQKNNSGKNGSTDWRFPRSLASCGVENQRRCFWPRGTLSCGYLDPIGWWRRRHLWNAGGEANTNLMYDDASRCSTLLWVSTPRSIDSGWTEAFAVWFEKCFSELLPSLLHLCESATRRWEPEQWAGALCETWQQDFLLEVDFFPKHHLFDRSFQVCQHSTGLWSWPCESNQTMKLSSKTNIRWWHRINAGLPKTVDDGRSQCKWSIDDIILPRWLFSKDGCWSIFRRRRR